MASPYRKHQRVLTRFKLWIHSVIRGHNIWVLVVPAACLFFYYAETAVRQVATLFGFLIGASKSPIASAVAPLIFGLLGAGVLAAIKQLSTESELYVGLRSLKSLADLSDDQLKKVRFESGQRLLMKLVLATVAMHLICCFIFFCRFGIHKGQELPLEFSKPSVTITPPSRPTP